MSSVSALALSGPPSAVFQTRTRATNRAETEARTRLSAEAPGRPGAALHRLVLQHVLVMEKTVLLELLLGKFTCSVELQLSAGRQPFILMSMMLAAAQHQTFVCM